MDLNEIKQFFADNQDNDEVKAYLSELKTVSKDDVEGYLETSEGKKLLQPKLDKYFTKGLETWKEKNLDQLVEEKYNEKHPEETEEQKELRQLRERLDATEKEAKREKLVNKALGVVDEKGLPKKLVNYFIGEDEDSTLNNITQLEETLSDWVKNKNKLRGNSPNPPNPNNPGGYSGKNPFKEGSINLTEQARLFKEDPDLYNSLKAKA